MWVMLLHADASLCIVKSENAISNIRLSLPEIMAQVRGFSPHQLSG